MITEKIAYGLLGDANNLFLQLPAQLSDAQVWAFGGLYKDGDGLGICKPSSIARHGAPPTDLSTGNCRFGGEVNKTSVTRFSFQSWMIPKKRKK